MDDFGVDQTKFFFYFSIGRSAQAPPHQVNSHMDIFVCHPLEMSAQFAAPFTGHPLQLARIPVAGLQFGVYLADGGRTK